MTPATFVSAVRVTLIGLDVAWGLYLIAIPLPQLMSSSVWVEALRVVPSHDPVLLGFAFLAGPVLAVLSTLLPAGHGLERPAYALAVLGLAVSGSCWGLTAVSFAASAFALAGLGAAAAASALAEALLHVLLAFTYHRRRR